MTNPSTVRKGLRSSLRSSPSRPKNKSSVRVAGSIKLRIGVTTSSSPAGSGVIHDGNGGTLTDSAAVGDDDSPEISRRRTNTVDRRLRLGVGWVSLVRLFGLAPSSIVGTTNKGIEIDQLPVAENGGGAGQPGDKGTKRPRQSRHRSRTDHRASSSVPSDSEPAEAEKSSTRERASCSGALIASTQATGRLSSPLSMPGLGISCRVIWCGVRVTSFELCPKTGLPITPGECLLELPRGTPWKSCQLVLELIATDQCVQHPGVQEALENWRNLHSQYGVDADTSTPQAEDGPHHMLGRVTVGWQVRRRKVKEV